MHMKPGKYRTKAGSTLTISGKHGGISHFDFDWVEEGGCVDCEPSATPDDGYLVWDCSVCAGGAAKWLPTQAEALHAGGAGGRSAPGAKWTSSEIEDIHEEEYPPEAWNKQQELIDKLRDALRRIADMTNVDDPESFRCDDPEGCLDTVFNLATSRDLNP